MIQNKLKLNEQNTEVLLWIPPPRRESAAESLSVGKASIQYSSVAKTIGVTLDAALSFDHHASAIVRSLSKVRSHFTCKATNSVAVSLILSQLDYANSHLAGLPLTKIKHLQAAQNVAARTATKCKKTDHIIPILRRSSWMAGPMLCPALNFPFLNPWFHLRTVRWETQDCQYTGVKCARILKESSLGLNLLKM